MGKYRIEIDREACVGDSACILEAPHTFELDDENIVIVLNEDADPPEAILEGARSCPTDAIALYDVQTGERVWPEVLPLTLPLR
jgi:ferredoxin